MRSRCLQCEYRNKNQRTSRTTRTSVSVCSRVTKNATNATQDGEEKKKQQRKHREHTRALSIRPRRVHVHVVVVASRTRRLRIIRADVVAVALSCAPFPRRDAHNVYVYVVCANLPSTTCMGLYTRRYRLQEKMG